MTENPFQLPGYQVIGMQDTGVAFDVHLQPPSPVACSSCGTIGDFVKNGTRDIRVMDLPVHGKPVTLWIARQRFQCKSCGSTFSLICFNAQSLKRTSSLTMALIYQPSKRIFCGWFEPLKSTTYSEYPSKFSAEFVYNFVTD